MELSRNRSPIVIIIMSEFKRNIIRIIRYFIVTQIVLQYFIGSLGDIMQLKTTAK